MDIVISPSGDTPIYQQLYDQLASQIMTGTLKSGTCLPPIRAVAKELRISVITVKKAWDELEHDGLIVTMSGKGCFVSDLPNSALDDKRMKTAAVRIEKDIAYYKSIGLSLEQVIDIMKKTGFR